MRQAMVSLKRKLQDRSRFDDKELRNIEREIRQSDMEIIKEEAAQLDATWANVRALGLSSVTSSALSSPAAFCGKLMDTPNGAFVLMR